MEFTDISIDQIKEEIRISQSLQEGFVISKSIQEFDVAIFHAPFRVDVISFILGTRGKSSSVLNMDHPLSIEANTLFVCLPGDLIQPVKTYKSFKAYSLIISLDFFKELHIDIKKATPSYLYIKNTPCLNISDEEMPVLLHFYKLLNRVTVYNQEPFRSEIINALTTAFLHKVASLISIRLKKQEASAEIQNEKRPEVFFIKFIELLSLNYCSERSVAFYADQLCVTPKHFSSIIKGISNKPATQWITDYVIQEAKILLKYSGMSIQEISYKLNFTSQTFFGKYFKRATGISPREYRNH